MNKKGDVTDVITFVVIVFFLAVGLLVAALANDKLHDVVTGTALNQTVVSSQIGDAMQYITSKGIQQGFVFIFGFLIISMMVSSFMVRVHPVWLFLYILFLGFAIILAVPLTNAYQVLVEADALSEVAAQQTMIIYIMHHNIAILIGATILSWVILFAKPGGGERI